MAADPAPYPGPLKQGDRGPAVVAVQGALHAWGAHRHKLDPDEQNLRLYGPTGDWLAPTTRQVGHFQAIHQIPVTNTFGPHVHDAMAKWYTAAGKKRLVELARERKVAAFHQTIADWAVAMAGKRDSWVYTQGPKRMDLLNRGGDPSLQQRVYGDCSSTTGALIILACRYVGLSEPNFGSWFNTYTLINHGKPVSSEHLLPGDRVHYGANTHVGLYVGLPFLEVLSFGEEPGPEARRTFYRPIYACRRDVS